MNRSVPIGPVQKIRKHKFFVIAGVSIVVLIAVAAVLASTFWPFEQSTVTKDIAEASDSSLTLTRFHKFYFPAPGCTAEGVTLRHGNRTFIQADKIVVRGSYTGLLSHRLKSLQITGLRIFIPAFGSGTAFHKNSSNIIIEQVIADGSMVELLSRDAQKAVLRFEVQKALLHNVGYGQNSHYDLVFQNPLPPGEIHASGVVGAWKSGAGGETPIFGQYAFRNADLGVFAGIAGTLWSTGKFDGTLKHINISGQTSVPDFHVRDSSHWIDLTTAFTAYVDGTSGDVYLDRVDAKLGKTHLVVQGTIAKTPNGRGKIAKVDLSTDRGRVQDVLGLFVTSKHAPMDGPMTLHAKIEIPPGDEPFLKRVAMRGTFGVSEASFTKARTQVDVDKLSAGARGGNKNDASPVASELVGSAVVEHGTADFSDLNFQIPGAKAHLHGTYSLVNHRVNLHGPMQVDTKIANTTTGFKSFFLKLINPIFKKRRGGEVIPVHILGTYEHPNFGIDVAGGEKKASVAPPPRRLTAGETPALR